MTHLFRLWWHVEDWPHWLRYLVFMPVLLSIPGVFAFKSGASLLPAQPGPITAAPLLVSVGYLVMLFPVIGRSGHGQPVRSMWRRFGLQAAGSALLCAMACFATFVGVPYLDVQIWGQPAEASFTIKRISLSGPPGCRTAITVADAPYMLDRICNIPPDILEQLSVGAPIAVIGRARGTMIVVKQAVWPVPRDQ